MKQTSWIKQMFWQIITGALGFYLAAKFIDAVRINIIPGESYFFGWQLTQNWQFFILIGVIWALINIIIKPVVNKITLPLKILTLGLFSIIINMAIVWFLDALFLEIEISGILPLLWTTLILWGLSFILSRN